MALFDGRLLAAVLVGSAAAAPLASDTCRYGNCEHSPDQASFLQHARDMTKSESASTFDIHNPPIRQAASLPGLASTHPYEYFSGFLNGGTPPSGRGTMYFHYICAMAPNWRSMPLTIWYNGGPGAPSTFGLFQEFGPYILSSDSFRTEGYRTHKIPTPIYNEWTWVNVTSICEIDSPPPVGASYCTEGNGTKGSTGGPSGDAYSCGPWTDKTTAAANHRAHISLLNDAFPEFEASQQPVSLLGESYGGVYVPLFANAWIDDPIKGPNGTLINFHGFAVGDPFWACIPMAGKAIDWCANLTNVGFLRWPNALPGPYWDMEFFHGHSQMSEALYRDIMATCSMDELKGVTMPVSEKCHELVSVKAAEEIGSFYVYNLYEACPPEEIEKDGTVKVPTGLSAPSPGAGDTGLGAPCLGSAMDKWFQLNATASALGIPQDNNFIVLDNGIGFDYTTDSPFVGFVYEKAIKAGLRVLVYDGDSDASGLQTAPIEDIVVPLFGNGTGVWTPAGRLGDAMKPLGLTMTKPWRPFAVNDQKVLAGYTIEWEHGQATFASIRGAGHLVPSYRPAAAFTLFQAFQNGTSPPTLPPSMAVR
eukprot:CAMPEP_0198519594 /NCGR_PEP_ID=MMETSP1462-20131121/19810_1 /TAXON_ID=1333877 /ORGANISM="Brandtodinium nutriculum, Strain RCC3387" /LENGTH=589 /DNA_ID=CAMNT_0044249209 /DNA_START=52 /DNA_END=1821 /DNA_ORIENTATION=-